jgi:hypothetical protein
LTREFVLTAPLVVTGLTKSSDQWALLGMDMKTGKSLVSFEFFDKNGARNFFANPFYAGVEVRAAHKTPTL